MSRRLVVVTSSDEEDDLQQQRTQNQSQPPQQFGIGQRQSEDGEEIEVQYEDPLPDIETVALGSTSGLNQPQLISDEDEDFIDVPDHFTPPSPPLPQQPHMPSFENSVPASATPSSNGPSQCPVNGVLRGLGLNLRNEWLESCIRSLETAVPGFSGLDSGTKAKFCFEQFLDSDMNFTGGGVLPLNVDSMHLVELAGPFVLQVDEIVNLSCPLRDRYHNSTAGPKRCLKLSMTDGIQRVFGMEYRPITDLQVLAFAGFKVAIKNVVVRRGLLMLVPEVLEVLGGCVQELEAARQRLVFEINKPPRGKRTRQGVLPPLATRATLAAWPQTAADNPVQSNASAQHSNNPTHQDVQGSAPPGAGINANNPIQNNTLPQHYSNSTRQDVQGSAPPGAGITANNPIQNSTLPQFHYSNSTRQDVQGAGINANNPIQDSTLPQHYSNSTRQDVQGSAPPGAGINANNPIQNSTLPQHYSNSTCQDVQGSAPPGAGINTNNPIQNNTLPQNYSNSTRRDVQDAGINTNDPEQSNTFAQHSNNSTRQDMQGSAPSGSGINTPRTTADSVVVPSIIEIDELPFTRDTTDHTSTRESTVLSTSGMAAEDNIGSTAQDVEDVEMAESPIHQYMLSGDRELPFTYLTFLVSKWDFVKGKEPQVQGKIKCYLTSVVKFEFKGRNTYELIVIVEDGSLIHKVLVHHNVVQKAIGYSPEELTAAYELPASETLANMKKVLANFQMFLMNFEGYLVIQQNESSDLPIAIEMNQGCPTSDAYLLLNRCRSHSDPIILSP